MIKYQIKCGPVEQSNRNLYEKKLIEHLKQINQLKLTKVIPGLETKERTIRMDINNNEQLSPIISFNPNEFQQQAQTTSHSDLNSLTDDEILSLLRQNNLPCGPVNFTTRSVYIKKLQSHFNNPNTNASNFDQRLADDCNAQVPTGTVQTEATNSESDDVIIDENLSTPKKQQVCDEIVNKPIKPLEFKLLKPSPVNEVQFEQNEYQPFRSQSTSFSGYDRSYVSSHPNEYFESFRPPVSEFSNRVNYSFNEQYDLTKRNKSLIKLINRDNDIYTPMQTPVYARNVVRQNIYSEPAPQQPVHLTKLNQQTPIIKALLSLIHI